MHLLPGLGINRELGNVQEGLAQVRCALCPLHVGLESPPQTEAEALRRLRKQRPPGNYKKPRETPPLSSSAGLRTGARVPGKWSPSAEESGGFWESQSKAGVSSAQTQQTETGAGDAKAVLPAEVSGQNQFRWEEVSPGLGMRVTGPFVSSKYPVPAAFPAAPNSEGPRGKVGLGPASGGLSPPLWNGACGRVA